MSTILNFAVQNAFTFVLLCGFLIFAASSVKEAFNKRFHLVFWISTALSFFSGGVLLHRLWYNIPRVQEAMGETADMDFYRGHWVVALAAFLAACGLILLIKSITERSLGERVWETTLFATILVFIFSVLFSYFH